MNLEDLEKTLREAVGPHVQRPDGSLHDYISR
jgi:hypothetical protein